jgi:hypothetical protein
LAQMVGGGFQSQSVVPISGFGVVILFMKVSPLTTLIAATLTLGGFVLGRYAQPTAVANESTQKIPIRASVEEPKPTPPAAGPVFSRDAAITAFLRDHGLDGTGPMPPEKLVAAVEEALREADPVRSHFLFARLMEELSPESAPGIYAMLRANLRGPEQQEYLRMLAHRWGTLDPERAMKELTEHGASAKSGTAAVLAGWASKSPEEAIKWLEGVKSPDKNLLQMSLISSLARSDSNMASTYAASLENPKDKHQAARSIFDEILRSGGTAAAEAWMKSLTDPEMKRGAFTSLTDQALAAGNLDKAVALLREHSGEAYTKAAAGDIASELSKQDITKGLEFAQGLPVGTQEKAFREVIEGWMEKNKGKDSLAASEYVRNLPPGPNRDAGAAAIVREVAREDVNAAIAWANVIAEPEAKQRALQEVAKNYFKQNPTMAAEWLPTSGLSAETLDKFANQVKVPGQKKEAKAERKQDRKKS